MFSQFSVEVPSNLSDVTGSPETGIPNLVCVYLPLVGECQNAIINLLVFRTLWGCDSQDASGHICYVLQDH